jgi:hypothetical protein
MLCKDMQMPIIINVDTGFLVLNFVQIFFIFAPVTQGRIVIQIPENIISQ